MTAIEFMEKMLRKHQLDFKQQSERGANGAVLDNIQAKINYYEQAIEALKFVSKIKEYHTKDMR